MQKEVTVAVLMGGMSSEHDVSLHSGAGVVKALQAQGYTAVPVVISRTGTWRFFDDEPVSVCAAAARLRDLHVDCVFIALHGVYGEDGRIQGFLEVLGMPYTGSGCAASALGMDKVRSKAVVQQEGVRVAGHIAFGPKTWHDDADAVRARVEEELGFPCVLKTALGGSSVGVEIVQEVGAFADAMTRVFETGDFILVESFVKGVEVTCSVLDTDPETGIRALPVTEIRPLTASFFDYEAKYTPGATQEITPAEIEPEIAKQVQQIAVHVHHIVGCAGWSRSDFIIDDGGPVWIEVNTVPGLTETSLYPQACAAAGISYEKMVRLFVEAALSKNN